jgi:hypothetical protein
MSISAFLKGRTKLVDDRGTDAMASVIVSPWAYGSSPQPIVTICFRGTSGLKRFRHLADWVDDPWWEFLGHR